MKQLIPAITFLIMVTAFHACKSIEKETADSIYFNGDIITMNDAQKTVEAVAIKDGSILSVGKWSDIQQYQNENTDLVDLKGQTMLPGFIDGHSHFSLGMKMLEQANLNSPPVDSIRTISDIIEKLKAHQKNYNLQDGEWILGWGYDPDQLKEKRHPNINELSQAFPNNPVFILHASFHMAVANTKAFEKVGITNETLSPAGGLIVKDATSGKPNGLLQETALYLVIPKLPTPTLEKSMELLKSTQAFYASHGITTAQDGLTDSATYSFLSYAADEEELFIDLEILGSFRNASSFLKMDDFGEGMNRLRLAGMKITTDGSPQGKTAFFKKPYLTAVPGCTHECRGFPMVKPKQLENLMAACYEKGIQLYVHANGDASIDMLLNTHEKVTDSLQLEKNIQRTVVIHSQFVRPDQLEKYKNYGFVPAFFTNHAFFWGDVHTENLGEARANFLSPMKTAKDMGIICTNHTDYNVTPLNQLFLLWTAVQRTSRTNKIIGEAERLTPYEGLKTITINGAYQHRVEDLKGSIEIGKLADFAILDRNPLKVDKDEIKDLQVMKTIKEDMVIFKK